MKQLKNKKIVIAIIVLAIIVFVVSSIYLFLTSPVDKSDTKDIKVTIESGTSSDEISRILKEKRLIKSRTLFLVKIKMNNSKSLKAATYNLNRSMSLNEIVHSLKNATNLDTGEIRITFKEGTRITDFAKVIAKDTHISYDEVIAKMKDKNYIKTLINKYWFLTDEILNNNIYYPLEGYLAPDTYHIDKDTDLETIIDTLLKQEDKVLTEHKSKLGNKVHKYITLASMVELEGTNLENRKMIAGIFNNRLNLNMNLGSDVTTYYAFQKPMTESLDSSLYNTSNPYNTRAQDMRGKLPVGPICNPSKESLEAAIYPTDSDYYYFVADKHKKIHYTKTGVEHNKKIAELKEKGDWLW